VLGVLDRHGRVDLPVLKELVSAARGLSVTFHRAFDEVPDPLVEIEKLVEAGVSRVLTSGGGRTAWEGRDVLRQLVNICSGRLTVLGAGGVRAPHIVELVKATGLTEIHARASAIPAIMKSLRQEYQDGAS